MPRFERMRAQHRCPVLLFDQFLADSAGKIGQYEFVKPFPRRQLEQKLPLWLTRGDDVGGAGTGPIDAHGVGQPFSEHVVAFGSFFGDDRLGHGSSTRCVACRSRLHERNQEVAPRHDVP